MAPPPKVGALALMLCALSMRAAASSLPDLNVTPERALQILDRRQASCSPQNPVSCSAVDPALASGLCCPSSASCISVDSHSTAICCPKGQSCDTIQVIMCDVGLQDHNKNPDGPVFTNRTSDTLPQCGSACCPFGYTCQQRSDESNYCKLDVARAILTPQSANTNQSPTTTTEPTTSAGATTTSSSSASQSPTNTPGATAQASSGIDSTGDPPKQANNPFPPVVFLAGFLPGIIIGALGVLAWVILTGRHKKQQPIASRSSTPYSMKPEVAAAAAVYDNRPNSRTDVAAKRKTFSKATKSLFQRKSTAVGTPGLPFDNADGWKTLTPPENNNIPRPGPRIPAGPGARFGSDAPNQGPTGTGYAADRSANTAAMGAAAGGASGPGPGQYGSSPNPPSYPITPPRKGPNVDASDEVIRIYSPPMVGRPPPAAVAPLRGMSAQRRSREAEIGMVDGYGAPQTRADQARAPFSSSDYGRNTFATTDSQVLSPIRYDAGGVQLRQRDLADQPRPERPETTFTDMLRQINFPDPMNNGNAPAMPSIPKQFKN